MTLDKFREQLDEIDKRIIELLGQRFAICQEIATTKRANQLPLMQPDRVAVVKRRVEALAVENRVSPQFASAMYDLIIAEACRLEEETTAGRFP